MNTPANTSDSDLIRKDRRSKNSPVNIPEDVALNIALAARALPDAELKDLLSGIIALAGEPLSKAKLAKLRLSKLKQLSFLEDTDDADLTNALAILQSTETELAPLLLPAIEKPLTVAGEGQPNGNRDNSNSSQPGGVIQVACASNNGDQIDGHFGSCARFLIYQLSPAEFRLIDIRIPEIGPPGEDKNALRANLVNDCQILFTVSIGGPAAAKVVRAGLHPVKLPNGGSAPEVLERLRGSIAEAPAPWLAKAMGIEPEQRVRFHKESNA